MNLYKLERDVAYEYEVFDGFVIAALSEEGARLIACQEVKKCEINAVSGEDNSKKWLGTEATCELIGQARLGIDSGVVFYSFRCA